MTSQEVRNARQRRYYARHRAKVCAKAKDQRTSVGRCVRCDNPLRDPASLCGFCIEEDSLGIAS